MSVSYTCPNPDCGVTLKTPKPVAVGKAVPCPKCKQPFVPEPGEKAEAPAGALNLVDDRPTSPPPPAPKSRFADEDEEDAASVKKGYGVLAETEEEKKQAKKNKPKFEDAQEKFKKSARGPAMSLLVMPSNLLTLEGLLTGVAGLGIFVWGMFPLVFNDAPPGEEETEEAVVQMLLGLTAFFWGAAICFGASQMQELSSYPWSMVGAVMGVLPLLVGIYALVMLQNPEVKAGFEEVDGALDEDEDEDAPPKKKTDDEGDAGEDDEEDEPRKKKRKGRGGDE
ncbi:MAG: hypothetical protein K2V38_10345 [Gemmataceae bacterium]|nr:hypothetical protein [Gemmataceae bacterium]